MRLFMKNEKDVRANHAPYMIKAFRKAMNCRSQLQSN